jgi:hypothetical protein
MINTLPIAPEDQRKAKKITILATWVTRSAIECGRITYADLESIIYSARAGGIKNVNFECDYTMADARSLVEQTMVFFTNKERAASFALQGLTRRLETTEELGLKRCSFCKEEKARSAFSLTDAYCRKCRSLYESERDRSEIDHLYYLKRKAKAKAMKS